MANKAKVFKVYWYIRDLPDRDITGIQHHILYFLQSCMNTNNESWYSVEKIAFKTRWSKSAIQRNLKALIKKGYIVIKTKGGGGAGDTNLFSINFEMLINGKGSSETPLFVNEVSTRVALKKIRVAQGTSKGGVGTPEDINEDIKEVFTQKNGRKGKKSFLLDDFQPNDRHLLYAKSKAIDLLERFQQFKASCKAQRKQSYDWDEEFMAYLLGSFKKINVKHPKWR